MLTSLLRGVNIFHLEGRAPRHWISLHIQKVLSI